jgi:hypothetical protein
MGVVDHPSLDGEDIWPHADHLAGLWGRPFESGVEVWHVDDKNPGELLLGLGVTVCPEPIVGHLVASTVTFEFWPK